MAKRIIAGILGAIAVFDSLVPMLYTFLVLKDFGNGEVPLWQDALGFLLMGSLALTGLWFGARFLFFALTGKSQQNNTWTRPVLLGIGLFFPGFVVSYLIFILTLSIIRIRSLADISIELIFAVSACVGVATTISSTILLLRKRALRRTT